MLAVSDGSSGRGLERRRRSMAARIVRYRLSTAINTIVLISGSEIVA